MDKNASRGRERFAVDFELNRLRAAFPDVKITDLAKRLGVSVPSIGVWSSQRRFPLSVYKAIMELVAPSKAAEYELRLTVDTTKAPFFITPSTARLARQYDSKRAGARIALRDKAGYYEIPKPAQALPEPVQLATPEAPPVQLKVAEFTDTAILAQQDALIEVLTRVTLERNKQAVELAQLRHRLDEREAALRLLADENKQLKQSISEWEQLADSTTHQGPTNGAAIADAVFDRLSKVLKQQAPQLLVELERINPKQAGRLSL